jgi:hypothetical protein
MPSTTLEYMIAIIWLLFLAYFKQSNDCCVKASMRIDVQKLLQSLNITQNYASIFMQ